MFGHRSVCVLFPRVCCLNAGFICWGKQRNPLKLTQKKGVDFHNIGRLFIVFTGSTLEQPGFIGWWFRVRAALESISSGDLAPSWGGSAVNATSMFHTSLLPVTQLLTLLVPDDQRGLSLVQLTFYLRPQVTFQPTDCMSTPELSMDINSHPGPSGRAASRGHSFSILYCWGWYPEHI